MRETAIINYLEEGEYDKSEATQKVAEEISNSMCHPRAIEGSEEF